MQFEPPSKSFIWKILIWFPLAMVIVLFNSGCHRQQSSQQAKLPSSNLPVEQIPPASPAPKINTSTTNTNTTTSAPPLLPNQYQGMPSLKGSIQYCKSVCTYNWSGSLFGGARNPSNICLVDGNTADGTATIVAHRTQSNPNGIRMDSQLAPDGVSKCIWEAPQCTVSNGCLTAAEKKKCPACGDGSR